MNTTLYINTNELTIARRAAASVLFDRMLRDVPAHVWPDRTEAEREAAVLIPHPEYVINLPLNADDLLAREVVSSVLAFRRRAYQ